MNTPIVTVQWSQPALAALREIGSRTVREKLAVKVSALAATSEPEAIGKPLHDELRGLYRIPFGRYRILYSVTRRRVGSVEVIAVHVRIVLVGIRKHGDKRDVYRLAQKLARRGEL